MESNLLKQGERLDDLQLGGLGLIQDPDKFCFGVDAVLLSDFAKVRQGETVLDMGTGNGIIPVLLAGKTEGKHFTGLEIQADTAEMAQRSVRYNHLEDRVEIVTGDIKEAATIFKPAFFDVITTNPPYMLAEHGLRNPDDRKAIARHEVLCTLDDILRESMRLLQDKGRFYMIHPYLDKEPTMVLVEGMRGAKPRVKIEPPLIMYSRDGGLRMENGYGHTGG